MVINDVIIKLSSGGKLHLLQNVDNQQTSSKKVQIQTFNDKKRDRRGSKGSQQSIAKAIAASIKAA